MQIGKFLIRQIVTNCKVLAITGRGRSPASGVRRIFKKGGPESLRRMNTKKKGPHSGFSQFFCPDLGEDQNKKVFTQIQPIFLPKFQRGGP